MKKRNVTLGVTVVAALALVTAGCGSKKSAETTVAPETTAAAAETTAAATETTAAATETTAAASPTALKDAGCPDPLVIQTDWFPEADHGWTYQMIGPDGKQDPQKGQAPALVDLELGYLVVPGSPVNAIADVDASRVKLNIAKLTQAVKEATLAQTAVEVKNYQVDAKLRQKGLVEVVEVMKHVGDWVQLGEPIFRLVSMEEVRVQGQLNIDEVSPEEVAGQPVQIMAGPFEGIDAIFQCAQGAGRAATPGRRSGPRAVPAHAGRRGRRIPRDQTPSPKNSSLLPCRDCSHRRACPRRNSSSRCPPCPRP